MIFYSESILEIFSRPVLAQFSPASRPEFLNYYPHRSISFGCQLHCGCSICLLFCSCKASGCEATHNSRMSMAHSNDFPPKPQERPARPEKSPCAARPSEMPVCSQTQKETHVVLEIMAHAKQYLKASVHQVQEKGPHAVLMFFRDRPIISSKK